jgi:hypothetical protein
MAIVSVAPIPTSRRGMVAGGPEVEQRVLGGGDDDEDRGIQEPHQDGAVRGYRHMLMPVVGLAAHIGDVGLRAP